MSEISHCYAKTYERMGVAIPNLPIQDLYPFSLWFSTPHLHFFAVCRYGLPSSTSQIFADDLTSLRESHQQDLFSACQAAGYGWLWSGSHPGKLHGNGNLEWRCDTLCCVGSKVIENIFKRQTLSFLFSRASFFCIDAARGLDLQQAQHRVRLDVLETSDRLSSQV